MDKEKIYREIIVHHSQKPLNFFSDLEGLELDDYKIVHSDPNTNCIDDFTIYLKTENDYISDVKFTGSGCSLSTAALSLLTERVRGSSVKVALDYLENYHQMVLTGLGDEDYLRETMSFKNVHNLPNRIECALIGYKTIKKGIVNGKSKL